MCGGGSNSAQKEADAAEKQRQQQIAQSTAAINGIFNDPARTAQYDKLGKDTTAYYTSQLDRQNADAQRKLTFALARSGNSGGSLQADEGKKLGEDYERGIIQATQKGEAAKADLMGQDESQKQSLLAMAQAGLDATTAGSDAASALRSTLQSSQANSTAQSLSDMFGDVSSIYQTSKDAADARRGMKYGYQGLYSPLFGAPSSNQNTGGGY